MIDFWDYFSLSFYPNERSPSTRNRNRNRKTTKPPRENTRETLVSYLFIYELFFLQQTFVQQFPLSLSLSLSLFHSLFHFLSLSFFTFTHKLLFHTNSMSLVVSIFVWFVGRLEIISTDFFPSTGASYLYTY